MVTRVSLILSVVLWLMVVWRSPSVRRPGAARSLWFVFVMFACAGTLYALEPVGREAQALLQPVGGAPVAWLCCAIGAAAGGRSMAIHSREPGAGQRQQLGVNVALALVGAVGILFSFVLSPPVAAVYRFAPAELSWRAGFYVGSWQSVLRWSIWLGYLMGVLVWLARLSYSQAGYAQKGTLARVSVGLRIAAFGCRVGYGYVLLKAVVVIGWLVGSGPSLLQLDQIADFASLGSVACVMTGVGYDAIVLGLRDAQAAVVHARQFCQLRSLSEGLKAAAPDSAGSIPAFGIRYRLSRRVIEIRDRQLSLRAYIDGDAPHRALAAATAAGLAGDDARATAEAAWIAAACTAKAHGREPRAVPSQSPEPGGSNLEAEAAWLVRVASAHRQHRVVGAFAVTELDQGRAAGAEPDDRMDRATGASAELR